MTIKGLEAKFISQKGKMAEIEINGQTITVPKENLPASIKIGQNFSLYFLDSKEATFQEKKLAKTILEEILNGS